VGSKAVRGSPHGYDQLNECEKAVMRVLTRTDLPLLKTPEGAILASNEPESGECRLNPQGRARPGA
jgi:hypothetical protein